MERTAEHTASPLIPHTSLDGGSTFQAEGLREGRTNSRGRVNTWRSWRWKGFWLQSPCAYTEGQGVEERGDHSGEMWWGECCPRHQASGPASSDPNRSSPPSWCSCACGEHLGPRCWPLCSWWDETRGTLFLPLAGLDSQETGTVLTGSKKSDMCWKQSVCRIRCECTWECQTSTRNCGADGATLDFEEQPCPAFGERRLRGNVNRTNLLMWGTRWEETKSLCCQRAAITILDLSFPSLWVLFSSSLLCLVTFT